MELAEDVLGVIVLVCGRAEVFSVALVLVCGSAEVSSLDPGVCCGGGMVEIRPVSVLTEDKGAKLVVTGDTENVVIVVVVVVVVAGGGFRGFTIHSSKDGLHLLFSTHRMRLEVPAFLTYPLMHL